VYRRSLKVRQRISEGVKRALAVPEVRQRRSEALKRAFAKPDVRQRRIDGLKRAFAKPEVRQCKSDATKRTWEDPELRQRKSVAMKRAWADPNRHQRWCKAIKRALAKPEVRQRKSDALKRAWADPTKRQRRIEAMQRARAAPGVQQRMIERQKAAWTPQRRVTRSTLSIRLWNECKAALQAGRRWPADWWDRPLMWRIIGDILLSRDGSMSNRELGKILDKAQIIKCPHGDTWAAALSSNAMAKSNAAKVLVAKVRRWVNKPGSLGRAKVAVNYVSRSA